MFIQLQDSMEVTALCLRLLMMVWFLLVTLVDVSCTEKADGAFPQVFPNRQQHFRYEPITVSCEGLEGLTGWRMMRKVDGEVKTCAAKLSASTGPCKIQNAFPKADSGEYWCELGGEKRSNSVNITVTDGSVILESPVHPVKEGDNVTLRCKMKDSSSNLTAEFFKDGNLMERSSTGNFTISSVSTSNQGRYKCRISGTGESPESWLTVRDHERLPSYAHEGPQLSLLLYAGVGVLALLVLLGGLLQYRKQINIRGTSTYQSSCKSTPSPQTVADEATAAGPSYPEQTYALVNKSRKRVAGETTAAGPSYPEQTYALINKPRKKGDDESLHAPVYHTITLEG